MMTRTTGRPAKSAQAGDADRLAALFTRNRLTPTHRAIAQALINNASEAPYLSAENLAELAGVSQSSVSRFAMAAGYRGYPELRAAVRQTLSAKNGARSSVELNPAQKAVQVEIEHLQTLTGTLADPSILNAIGASMASSRPLGVLGLRNCMPLAQHLVYLACRVHPDVRLISAGDSTVIDKLEQLKSAGGTCLLVIALPRHSRDLFTTLQTARDLGLSIVSLVDTAVSAVAEASDLSIHAPLGTQLIFDIPTAPMVLSMLIVQAMCNAMPSSWQARLERFESLAGDARIFT
jgi:DNA-binding MurR/RpiR family transcriptional regulator